MADEISKRQTELAASRRATFLDSRRNENTIQGSSQPSIGQRQKKWRETGIVTLRGLDLLELPPGLDDLGDSVYACDVGDNQLSELPGAQCLCFSQNIGQVTGKIIYLRTYIIILWRQKMNGRVWWTKGRVLIWMALFVFSLSRPRIFGKVGKSDGNTILVILWVQRWDIGNGNRHSKLASHQQWFSTSVYETLGPSDASSVV